MELKQLSHFVTVVKEGTISGAARKLNLSQPPLSTQMKQLEDEFGCVLFERGSRKIQLTEAGQLLYERAVTMLELSEATRRELLDYNSGLTGALRLGVVSSVGRSGPPRSIRPTPTYALNCLRQIPISSWNSCAPTCWNWPLCVLLFMLKALFALPCARNRCWRWEVKPFSRKKLWCLLIPAVLTAALPWRP